MLPINVIEYSTSRSTYRFHFIFCLSLETCCCYFDHASSEIGTSVISNHIVGCFVIIQKAEQKHRPQRESQRGRLACTRDYVMREKTTGAQLLATYSLISNLMIDKEIGNPNRVFFSSIIYLSHLCYIPDLFSERVPP